MVKPKYIDEILNWFNMETPRKGSWRMVYVYTRLKSLQENWHVEALFWSFRDTKIALTEL